jgi:hypothetical protein
VIGVDGADRNLAGDDLLELANRFGRLVFDGCGIGPPICGIAMTFGNFTSSSVAIWSSARPTSIAAPATRSSRNATANAASSTRLPWTIAKTRDG